MLIILFVCCPPENLLYSEFITVSSVTLETPNNITEHNLKKAGLEKHQIAFSCSMFFFVTNITLQSGRLHLLAWKKLYESEILQVHKYIINVLY